MYVAKTDKRYKHHVKELKKYGFSNAETWSLYNVVAEFILPRLKLFRKVSIAYPMGLSMNKWRKILDKMIFAFEWADQYDKIEHLDMPEKESKANWEKYEEGLTLFKEHFMDLWW